MAALLVVMSSLISTSRPACRVRATPTAAISMAEVMIISVLACTVTMARAALMVAALMLASPEGLSLNASTASRVAAPPASMVTFFGSISSVPVFPAGADVSTEPLRAIPPSELTSTNPPFPPSSPPRAMRVPFTVVLPSDSRTMLPPLKSPLPLTSIIASDDTRVCVDESNRTSPPSAPCAPRAVMVPKFPAYWPLRATVPVSVPASPADTSMVPRLVTSPSPRPVRST